MIALHFLGAMIATTIGYYFGYRAGRDSLARQIAIVDDACRTCDDGMNFLGPGMECRTCGRES